ncbi:GIY-YIG nuclease family protein [Psychrobacter namhaensis]|uniref:GIY-YIG nuclease family protein n=1 Tax=Psychrobacter namhaensis TaxID=292734 RepID=UPI0018DFF847|nr:GIY-YIG nuclease family protein [Psychrobacter namhaensis]
MTDRNCTIQNTPKQAKTRKKPTVRNFDDFIKSARVKFGSRFDYSKVDYVNTQEKIEIVCKEHGSFWQAPCDHLRDRTKHACLECSNKSFCYTHTKFVSKAKIKHDNYYTYPESPLSKLHDFVPVICPKHGLFEQAAYSHLAGFGCRICADESNTKTQNDFLEQCVDVHGEKYDYSKTKYVKGIDDIDIICKTHGVFSQKAAIHVGGSGCQKCYLETNLWTRTSFQVKCDKNNRGLGCLYVIKCSSHSEVFYKIGITSKTTGLRMSGNRAMPYDYEVLYEVIGHGHYIWDLEKRLHNLLRDNNYKPLVYFGGRTECFDKINPIKKLLCRLSSSTQIQLLA